MSQGSESPLETREVQEADPTQSLQEVMLVCQHLDVKVLRPRLTHGLDGDLAGGKLCSQQLTDTGPLRDTHAPGRSSEASANNIQRANFSLRTTDMLLVLDGGQVTLQSTKPLVHLLKFVQGHKGGKEKNQRA